MINYEDLALSGIARIREMIGKARVELLDIEIELNKLERELRAERIRRMRIALDEIDLTSPNADAPARAAEEYRASGSYDPEDYLDGGDCTA